MLLPYQQKVRVTGGGQKSPRVGRQAVAGPMVGGHVTLGTTAPAARNGIGTVHVGCSKAVGQGGWLPTCLAARLLGCAHT